MSPRNLLAALTGLTLGLSALPAQAHVHITSHPTRYGRSAIKSPPCGKAGGKRSDNVLVFRPGETILLEWDEYIFHPGYFRISFDEDGDDDFVDPPELFDFFTNETVLLDNLFPDHTREDGPIFRQEVTLPNIECDNCTLQLVQVMTDKPPYVPGTNDLYYNCLDLVLTNDEAAFETDFVGGGGCSISTPAKGASLPALFGLSLLALFMWRSRSARR